MTNPERRINRSTQRVTMLGSYTNFFTASSSAAAAFIGLLFVAITVIDSERLDAKKRAINNAMSESSFALLLDAFFVSISALIGDLTAFGIVNVVMASLGLLLAVRLLILGIDLGHLTRGAPHRGLNIALPTLSTALYLAQFGFGLALLLHQTNSIVVRILVFVILGLFASALIRAWEITRS